MIPVIQTVLTGITAFSATNVDDIVILMLLFSQRNASFQTRHIVIGQYLGLTVLFLASLPGFIGGLMVPKAWIGLLGLVPIGLGILQLFKRDDEQVQWSGQSLKASSKAVRFLSPQVLSVTGITIANGADNIGIYVPLFASSTGFQLLVILGVFYALIGVWCYAALQLAGQPTIARLLMQYGRVIVPVVFIGLGVFILIESHSYQLLPWF
ncbi:cadmium resistance transporter [Leptolyngbya sp. FACHB-36]|uniref:cadmium resistance transporter n=1 Tax=Leptolyngbya sp. FACHB-36 TaxID=2692808 RepID=UPI0016816284|nr:cadmium resistance transporter [Leptolyngbya sp. FACHB-36]MBD2022219.1 cadmium resistance transporter [Leptolyngbya sp. FACHB-36]